MEFIYNNWAKAGGFIFIILILFIFLFTPFTIFNLQTIGWLNLAFLMLHQFEEYVYPGRFLDFFSSNISRSIGLKINNISAFHVNVTLGWSFYLLAAVLSGIYPILLFSAMGISLLNGIVHTGAAIFLKKYNPGFLTAFFIFIPFSVIVFQKLILNNFNFTLNWFYIIILVICGTILIPLTLYIFKGKK